MGRQYNKVLKRRRRLAHLKRKKQNAKTGGHRPVTQSPPATE